MTIRTGAACLLAVALTAAEFATGFPPGDPGWALCIGDPGTLAFPGAGADAGLAWRSDALAAADRELDLGTGPCEIAVDLRMTAGRSADWRCAGIGISLGSAPADAASDDDWSIVFAAREQGLLATAVAGRPVWGTEVRPGVWNVQNRNLAQRFQVSMSGAGGSDYSIAWPNAWVAGTRIRFHAWRDAASVIRFTLFHADGAPSAWWEGQLELPARYRDRPLRHLSIFTTNEEQAYRPGAKPGKPLMSGIVEAVRARNVDDGKPHLAEPFPDQPPAYAATRGPSCWLPQGGLEALRARFAAPAFADYRTVLLRNAATAPATISGSPGDAEPIVALLWAYLLTGDESHWDRMLPLLDAASGPSDLLPSQKWGSPGHPCQRLSVMEFEVHRYAALAMVYDACFAKLDAERKANVQRSLRRAVSHYERQIAANDWWYRNNPSNTIGVGNGASAICALALRHEEPERARRIAALAARTIREHFRGVAPDGACLEGNMYWNYGMHFPLLLGYALRNLDGDDQGLLRSPQVENAQRYVEANLGGDGRMITFNDTQPWLNGWVVISAAGGEFDRPFLRWFADHEAGEFAKGGTYPEQDRGLYAVGAFLLRGDRPAPAEMPALPTLAVLASTNEGVMRSEGVMRPRLLTGVKGNGRDNTHHANADQGSFVLHANGEAMLIDPGYFDGDAERHSLPTIAGHDWLLPTAYAPISDAWEQGAIRSMTVDATAAHAARAPKGKPADPAAPVASRVRRVLVQIGSEALIVLDDIAAPAGATVTTRFQAGVPAVASGSGAVLTGRFGSVALTTDGPALTLQVAPRRFAKEWVFAKSGAQWSTISGSYVPDPARPLISVLAPAAAGAIPAAATVAREAGRIIIRIGKQSVTFSCTGGQWASVQP